MSTFRGIVPPLLTPHHADGTVDLTSLDRLVDAQLDTGVHGLFILGSSGQVAYLTDAERDTVTDRVVARVAGRVPVLAGTPDLTARRCAEHVQRAVALGVDAVVVTAPFYALNDEGEVERHFRMVADASSVPVFAYDVPVRVGRSLSAPVLLRLAQEGVLAGVKDSSGDDVGFRQLVADNAADGHRLQLFTGHEVMCDGMFLLGADGAVPGLANVDPAGYVRLWEAAQDADWVRARAEQDRLLRLFDIAFVPQGRSGDAAGIGAFKAACALLGMIDSPAMPPPLTGLTQSDTAQIREILVEVGLLS